MEIIHTSDIHLVPEGFENTPLEGAFYGVLNEIAEKATEHNSRYLLIAGDMFDKPNPPFNVILKTVSTLRKLRENNVRVIVVPGNHDISRSKTGVLNVLAEAGLINLLDFSEEMNRLVLNPLVFEDDKLVFYGIPGFRGSSSREIEYLKPGLIRFKDIDKYKDYSVIVLAHINTKFAGYDPSRYGSRYGKLYLEYEDLLNRFPGNTTYVALGHIHIPVPLDRTFRGNIAYPGAPIGIDVLDLLETLELKRLGASRRTLLVDISGSPPLVKSISLESSPKVYYERISIKTPEELRDHLIKLTSDMGGSGYVALILDVSGVDRLSSDIEALRRDLMRKRNIYVRIRLVNSLREQLVPLVVLDNVVAHHDLSVSELELNVLKEYASKRGLRVPVDKLKWIIDFLGSLHDMSPEKLLDVIIKELGERGN